ncbi:MAG: hypothetical protein AAF228_13615 [Pseudomonadota bacterium]
MKKFFVLNASSREDVPGDIYIYKYLDKLILGTEPIDVENEEFFAFDTEGRKIDLFVINPPDKLEYVAAKIEENPTHKDVVFRLLKFYLTLISEDGRFGVQQENIDAAKELEEIVALIPEKLISEY